MDIKVSYSFKNKFQSWRKEFIMPKRTKKLTHHQGIMYNLDAILNKYGGMRYLEVIKFYQLHNLLISFAITF